MASWKDCPLELKEMVVRQATEKTRNAFRVCSFHSNEMVQKTKTSSIDQILIGRFESQYPDKWIIMMNKTKERVPFEKEDPSQFDTFEDFQEEVTKILNANNYIKTFIVRGLTTDVPLDLLRFGSRLRAETLSVYVENGETLERILSQFEPIYLSRIEIFGDRGNDKIYDMQQIICAEKLEVWSTASIREDQLMKLQARYIFIDNIQCSISEYIKKCALEASSKIPQFSFGGPKIFSDFENMHFPLFKKFMLKTDHPQLSLQLETVLEKKNSEWKYKLEGRTFFDSVCTASNFLRRDQSELRKLRRLALFYDKKLNLWNIKVKRNDLEEEDMWSFGPEKYDYKFHLLTNAQEKMDEILANTDHITVISINLKGSKKPMQWSTRNKKLSVLALFVYGEHSITGTFELMQQIDPVFVKKLVIVSKEVDDRIFNTPHFEHAGYVDISGAVFNDTQLLRMRAQKLSSTDKYSNGVQNKSLTAKGINQYMKKCLIDTEQPCHIFVLKNLAADLNVEEMFEGCNTVMSESVENCVLKIVNVPETEEKYEMVVEYNNNCLYGARRKIDQPIPCFGLLQHDISTCISFSIPSDLMML